MVFLSPDLTRIVQRGDVLVVIDVLRCSSSIIIAFAKGVASIVPVQTVKAAKTMSKMHPGFILAGERGGIPPSGFQFGNSPSVFSHVQLKEANLILTTTSGTVALTRVQDAKHVLIGALLNAEAVAESAADIARQEGCGITLIASGKKGAFSLEDFLGAGAIAHYCSGNVTFSDAAHAALLAFHAAHNSLLEVIKQGHHAKYLISIGFEEDVDLCSHLNRYSLVPYLTNGILRSARTEYR